MSRLPAIPSQRYDDSGDEPDDYQIKRPDPTQKTKRLMLEIIGRWYWVALFVVLGYLCATYYLSKAPKQYAATSTMLVKQRTATVMSRDQIDEIDLGSQEALNTVAERIRRLDLLERVASREDVRKLPGLVPSSVEWRPNWLLKWMGSDPLPAGQDRKSSEAVPAPSVLGGMIAGWTSISIRRGTRLMDVTITHPVPEVSKNVADAIIREYLAEIVNERNLGRASSIDLLSNEMDEARDGLQAARMSLATYARANQLNQQLDVKEAEVDALKRRYREKHPKMITAEAELARLKQAFISEFEAARSAPSDKAYWEAAGKTLPDPKESPADYLRATRQTLAARGNVLLSETDSLNQVYESMITRRKEASVNQEAGESTAEVSSLARVPGWPSSPVAKDAYFKGVAGGGALGMLIILLLVRLDNKYHTVAQIAGDTGQTVLAAISDIRANHLEQSEKLHYKQNPDSVGDEGTPRENWDERIVFRPGVSGTTYAEMYRVLRASVSLLGDETRRKVTLFTSALPGEGKTSTSTNFALAAAGQGRRTILIDLDLRKPSVHNILGISREPENGGITECLANMASFEQVIIRNTGQENFHVIVSGRRAPNPGELLDTGRLRAILAQACRDYDVVVLDTAPLLAVPDTRVIAPLAHNVCLVVRAEYVPKGAVRRVLDIVEEDGTQLSGIIFNGYKEKRSMISANYTYGYYGTGKYGNAGRYGYGQYGAYGTEDKPNAKKKRKRKQVR